MNVAERYLELGLRVGKHVDDLVESYHGPAELAARIEAEEPRSDPSTLRRRMRKRCSPTSPRRTSSRRGAAGWKLRSDRCTRRRGALRGE